MTCIMYYIQNYAQHPLLGQSFQHNRTLYENYYLLFQRFLPYIFKYSSVYMTELNANINVDIRMYDLVKNMFT